MATPQTNPPTDAIAEKNQKAFTFGLIAGILLIIAGVTGAAAWEAISKMVDELFINNPVIGAAFSVMILIASFGGVIVIFGALMFKKENIISGKLLMMLGVGVGLIGLIISLAATIGSVMAGGNPMLLVANLGLGFLGIVFSIISKKNATPRPKPRKGHKSQPRPAMVSPEPVAEQKEDPESLFDSEPESLFDSEPEPAFDEEQDIDSFFESEEELPPPSD